MNRDSPKTSGRWLIDATNSFIDMGVWAKLSNSETRVLFVLMRRADGAGMSRAGMSRICSDAGVSRSTGARALKMLKHRGIVESSGRVKSQEGDWATAIRRVVPPAGVGSAASGHTRILVGGLTGRTAGGSTVGAPVGHKEPQLTASFEEPQQQSGGGSGESLLIDGMERKQAIEKNGEQWVADAESLARLVGRAPKRLMRSFLADPGGVDFAPLYKNREETGARAEVKRRQGEEALKAQRDTEQDQAEQADAQRWISGLSPAELQHWQMLYAKEHSLPPTWPHFDPFKCPQHAVALFRLMQGAIGRDANALCSAVPEGLNG